MTIFYPDLDLSPLDMFKVVRGEQLVDDTRNSQPVQIIALLDKDTQVDPGDDRVINDANLEVTCLEGLLEELLTPKDGQ